MWDLYLEKSYKHKKVPLTARGYVQIFIIFDLAKFSF